MWKMCWYSVRAYFSILFNDLLFMIIVAKNTQGIIGYMTVNCPQLKTGAGIILYMGNKVKSKKFVVVMMLNV